MQNLHIGDILLVKGKTPVISRLIRWVTKSEYTHVAIVYGENRIAEIDVNRKLSIYPMDPKETYYVFRYKGGLKNKQKTDMKRLIANRTLQNAGYDWLKILSMFLQSTFKKPFFLDIKNRVICSEIVDYIYMDIGIDLVPNSTIGHVSPADIANSTCIEFVGATQE